MGALTGVGGFFCAAHLDRAMRMHGHTWDVVAWWYAGEDAVSLQAMLRACLVTLDHEVLPEERSTGEQIAEWVGRTLAEENMFGVLHSVEVSRSAERIFARWFP